MRDNTTNSDKTYLYHVCVDGWNGYDLEAAEHRPQPDWWEGRMDYEYGVDGWGISLYETLGEAQVHQAEYGGEIVIVTIETDDNGTLYTHHGSALRRNDEGYYCYFGDIPARYLAVLNA